MLQVEMMTHSDVSPGSSTMTAQPGTMPKQQSSFVLFLLIAPPLQKTWQQPLDLDPRVSLRNQRTNYSTVGHFPPLLPPLQQRRCIFSAIEGLWSYINRTIIFRVLKIWVFFLLDLSDEKNSFKFFHHIICMFCNRRTHCLKHFCPIQWFTCQLQTCQSKKTVRIILC